MQQSNLDTTLVAADGLQQAIQQAVQRLNQPSGACCLVAEDESALAAACSAGQRSTRLSHGHLVAVWVTFHKNLRHFLALTIIQALHASTRTIWAQQHMCMPRLLHMTLLWTHKMQPDAATSV